MRWVVKVGSGVLVADDGTLKEDRVVSIANQIVELHQRDVEVVLVTSGAIASGFSQLGYTKIPESLAERQACASVGQMRLVRAYDEVFHQADSKYPINAGLVLLTHDDIKDETHRANALHTVDALLKRGAIPVINENDAVAVEEILMGDNDKLAGMVARMLSADRMVLLTNVDGFLDSDGKVVLTMSLAEIDDYLQNIDSSKSALGSGGMKSKIEAARSTALQGISTTIANGNEDHILLELLQDADVQCTHILIDSSSEVVAT